MRIVKTIGQLRQVLDKSRRKGQKIGFVPTMGYFHEGHLSLMRRAKKECDILRCQHLCQPQTVRAPRKI